MSSLSEDINVLRRVILDMNLTDEQLNKIQSQPAWAKYQVGKSSNTSHVFMTINLPKDASPAVNYQSILSLCPRITCLMGAEAVMEFHPHPHCHILFLRPSNFRKANLIRSVVRALSLDRPELVDVLTSTKAQDYANRQAYIRGTKASSDKTERVLLDKQIRSDNEIPDLICL